MKTKLLIIFIALVVPICIFSQTISFPDSINIPDLLSFKSSITKVSLPFYADNIHKMPTLVHKRALDPSKYNFQLKPVPTVCLDDFRFGHKFENNLGDDGIGYLSIAYWLPSSGNYLLFYCILENDMDYYREFLVATNRSGACIDYLLVRDGWRNTPDVNFTQSLISANLLINMYEIRNLSSSYIGYSSISSFIGQKAVSKYNVSTEGRFVCISTDVNPQRTFNISELRGLISSLAN